MVLSTVNSATTDVTIYALLCLIIRLIMLCLLSYTLVLVSTKKRKRSMRSRRVAGLALDRLLMKVGNGNSMCPAQHIPKVWER